MSDFERGKKGTRDGQVFPYGSATAGIGSGPIRPRAGVSYARRMKRIGALLSLVSLVGFASTACLGVPTDGSLTTPGAPDTSTQTSRLPTLLQQLQGGNAGVELFDATPKSEVLGVQDAQGKDVGATATVTPTGTRTVTATPTTSSITATPTLRSNTQPVVVNTPTPTRTLQPGETPQPTATPVPPTATPTSVPATATPTPIPPTPTRTPTPQPTPTIPVETAPTATPIAPPLED